MQGHRSEHLHFQSKDFSATIHLLFASQISLPKLWHVHTAFKMLQYHEISIWGFGWRSKVLRVPLDVVAVSVPEFRGQRPIASLQKARISRVQFIQNEVDDFFVWDWQLDTTSRRDIVFRRWCFLWVAELPLRRLVKTWTLGLPLHTHALSWCLSNATDVEIKGISYLNAISVFSLRLSSRWFFGQLGLPVFEHLQEHNLTASCRLNKNSIPA